MLASARNFLRQPAIRFRLLLVLGALSAFGCKPKIGEDCAISTDCSLSGDRLCDITQPGGYCTVFNCEPGQCPDEAACTAFSEGTCSTSSVSTRLRRTFCMQTCDDDGDCRGGYRCLDTTKDPARTVVDINPPNRRICAVPTPPSATDAPPPQRDPATCFPSDASFDTSRPEAGPVPPDSVEASTGDTPLDTSSDRTDTSDSNRVETSPDTGADVDSDTSSDDASEDGSAEDAGSDAEDDAAPE